MAVLISEPVQRPGVEIVVCHCFGVTDRQIQRSMDEAGAATLEDVMQQTGAGRACAGCHYRIRRMLAGQSPTCGPFAGCEPIRGVAACACNAA